MSIAPSGGCAPAWAAWYSRPSFLTRSAILATSSRMRRPRRQQALIACITNRERRSVQLVQEGRQGLALLRRPAMSALLPAYEGIATSLEGQKSDVNDPEQTSAARGIPSL